MTNAGSDEYSPPTSQAIAEAQDTDDAYRLLLAQRKLYSQSKRWLTFRWLGMLMIAIAAPVVAVVWPNLAVGAGAVAGAWIFVGRTWLSRLEQSKAEQAAAVQDELDRLVFGMPAGTVRSALPSLEEIAMLAGADESLKSNAAEGKLTKWYPIDTSQSGLVSVAICQRANASYSDRLLKLTSAIWVVTIAVWVAALIVISLLVGLSLAEFLLGIAFPVLPAFLDVWEYSRGIRRAAQDRRDLVTTIEEKLRGGAKQLEPQDVLVWQAQIFDVRRSAPQVPDAVYWLTRRRNEKAMESAARQLSKEAEGNQ